MRGQGAVLKRFWSIFRQPTSTNTGSENYRVFTTRYDQEISGAELFKAVSGLSAKVLEQNVATYESALASWRVTASIAGIESLERIARAHGPQSLTGTVVSILIDNSGSMKGQRAILVAALSDFLTDYFFRLGARVEVLGHTTRSWRGGKSRRDWRRAGKPGNPGRLCDLLHIVYRSADEPSPGIGWSIRNMLRDDILKENVDGEAVLWASARLRARPEERKILIYVSDGAPVDDSTLMENGPEYLDRHMIEVSEALQTRGDIELVGIGIDHDLTRYIPRFVRVSLLNDYSEKLLPFLEHVFAEPATAHPDSVH